MYNIKQILNEELILHNRKSLLNEQSLGLIENPEYIKHVLGINIPINESYSFGLRKQIIEKQILFENLVGSINKFLGDPIGKGKEMVSGIKSLKDIALFFKDILLDAELMKLAVTTIKSELSNLFVNINNTVTKLITKIKLNNLEMFKKITNLFTHIKNVITNLTSDNGWKGFLAMFGFSILLSYIQKNFIDYITKKPEIGEYIESFFENVTSILNSFQEFKQLSISGFEIEPIIKWVTNLGKYVVKGVAKAAVGMAANKGADILKGVTKGAIAATGTGTVIAAFSKATDIINFIAELLNPIIEAVNWDKVLSINK